MKSSEQCIHFAIVLVPYCQARKSCLSAQAWNCCRVDWSHVSMSSETTWFVFLRSSFCFLTQVSLAQYAAFNSAFRCAAGFECRLKILVGHHWHRHSAYIYWMCVWEGDWKSVRTCLLYTCDFAWAQSDDIKQAMDFKTVRILVCSTHMIAFCRSVERWSQAGMSSSTLN